jgi:hypothetical protein
MNVFKFGGASVKDAAGIKNVVDVLRQVGHDEVLLVVSAMGKTTNALEVVVKNYFDKSPALQSSLQEVKKYHNQIVEICSCRYFDASCFLFLLDSDENQCIGIRYFCCSRFQSFPPAIKRKLRKKTFCC